MLCMADILNFLKCEPLHVGAHSRCQFTPHNRIWRLLLNAVKLLSNSAQRATACTFSATGGLFSNDTHTRWSLRVAGGGNAVKDSSPGRQTQLLLLALEKEKVERGPFLSKGNIFDKKLETWQPGELTYDTE